jgi:hypothetical protein
VSDARPHPDALPALLCVSYRFSPDTAPGAIQASHLLAELSTRWDITVVSATPGPSDRSTVRVALVPDTRPAKFLHLLRRMGLTRIVELCVWPDERIFWVLPALLTTVRLARTTKPSAIVVFMMPFSAGLVGTALRKLTGLPLIMNLGDSLTCTDMNPTFQSRIHYHLAQKLEDHYVRRADAITYVSRRNLEAVKRRQRLSDADKLHLVRRGAHLPIPRPRTTPSDRLEIVYTGAMAGWWTIIKDLSAPSWLARMRQRLLTLGRYQLTTLDMRTHSPAVVGCAILDMFGERAEWADRIAVTIVGNKYPRSVVDRALMAMGLHGFVTVHDSVPHDEVAGFVASADLLFLTLPMRTDGSAGGRISAKTYEYLMTDKPILAAVPVGENRDYLIDKPGVWVVDPDDRQGMKSVITEVALAKFSGQALSFDRGDLRKRLAYKARAEAFADVVQAGIARRHGLHGRATPPSRTGFN